MIIICVAAACALVPAAAAHAATTTLRVRVCETGDTPKQRAATFYARMYAVKDTNTMEMRFTLINRAGDDIPLGARIICACDAFHAMTSDRPYRAALPATEAIAELTRNSGRQFDPAVVDAVVAEAALDLGRRQEAA